MSANRKKESDWSKNAIHNIVYLNDATKNILDGWTDRGKTVYPPPPLGSGGIIIIE